MHIVTFSDWYNIYYSNIIIMFDLGNRTIAEKILCKYINYIIAFSLVLCYSSFRGVAPLRPCSINLVSATCNSHIIITVTHQ